MEAMSVHWFLCWLRRRPDLVRVFIELSVDPDFMEDLLLPELLEDEKEAIMCA